MNVQWEPIQQQRTMERTGVTISTVHQETRGYIKGKWIPICFERPRLQSSPHIAYQEKGRQQSETLVDTLRKRKDGVSELPASESRTRSQHASPPRLLLQQSHSSYRKYRRTRKQNRSEEIQNPRHLHHVNCRCRIIHLLWSCLLGSVDLS